MFEMKKKKKKKTKEEKNDNLTRKYGIKVKHTH